MTSILNDMKVVGVDVSGTKAAEPLSADELRKTHEIRYIGIDEHSATGG